MSRAPTTAVSRGFWSEACGSAGRSGLRALVAFAFALLLAAGLAQTASASGVLGGWQTTVNGVTSTMRLTGVPAQLSGQYEEGEIRLNLRGSLRQNQLQLALIEPTLGIEIGSLQGTWAGDNIQAVFELSPQITGRVVRQQARFVRLNADGSPVAAAATAPAAPPAQGAAPGGRNPATGPAASPSTPPPAATSPANRANAAGQSLDPRLIGDWVNERIITSGGSNFASFTSVRIMRLDANGEVRQWVKSMGGGGNWSYGNGAEQLDYTGRWHTRDGMLYMQGEGQSAPGSLRYRFSDDYLVTETARGRVIWQRR